MLSHYPNDVVKNPSAFSGMQNQMEFYCSECGELFTTTPHNYIKRGFTRCHNCATQFSHGENQIKNVLENIGISYIPQKKFDDCKDKKALPFDFYIPSKRMAIEFDGEQHYKSVEYFGGENELINRQKHDKIKT